MIPDRIVDPIFHPIHDMLVLLGAGMAIIIIGCGLFFGLLLLLLRLYEGRDECARLAGAKAVLAKHGWTTRLYCPTLETDDEELQNALSTLSCTGYVIVDERQQILGNLAGPPTRKPKGPALRLVSSKR